MRQGTTEHSKSLWARWTLLGGGWLALWVVLPIPVPYNMDFLMLYAATVGLRHGVGLYDHAGQTAVMAVLLGKTVRLPYYVYPPWYALSTAFLGWLPLSVAARVWFGLSLGMVVLGLGWWLRPSGPRAWLLVALGALVWLPTWGLLVGQYVAPVWLGMALAQRGWATRRPAWLAVGMALLTFKPHVGVWALALVGGSLLTRVRHQAWARQALCGGAALIGGLVLSAFVLQPSWPVAYRAALANFGAQSTFGVCEPCAGAAALLLRWLWGAAPMAWLWPLGLALGAAGTGWALVRRVWRWPPEHLLTWGALAPLWANPYVNNYDYLLLLAPLAWMWTRGRRRLVAFLGVLPWLGLVWGRAGVNTALGLSLLGCSAALVFVVERASRRRQA